MRILITGGTGFLGSHFLKLAPEQGHEVVAFRRPGSKTRINLDREPEWVECRWDDPDAVDWSRIDALVHLASAGVSPQPVDWATAMRVNVSESMELVLRAEDAGVPKILLCGSCFEFGVAAQRFKRVPADTELQPRGPYATSKAAFTVAAAGFARTSRSSLVLLRPFHYYGEGQHESNFWPSLRRAALAGEDFQMTPGEQARDFQAVQDTADDFLRALDRWPGVLGEMKCFNLGSGVETTLVDFARRWWRDWQAKGNILVGALPYRDGEVMRLVPEIAPPFRRSQPAEDAGKPVA